MTGLGRAIAISGTFLLIYTTLTPALAVAQENKSFWNLPDSIRIHYFTVGSGRKVLVLHGGPGIPFLSSIPGLDSLSDSYEFIYYDQRGCGRSTRPIDHFDNPDAPSNFRELVSKCGIGVQIKDIDRIRQILGEEKLIIVGFSYGALLASLYAKDYPGRVEAIIFISPAPLLSFPPEGPILSDLIKPLLPDSMKAPFEDYLTRAFNFTNLFQQTDRSLSALNCEMGPYFLAALKAKHDAVPDDFTCETVGGWGVQGIYMSLGMSYDYRPELKSVTAPVLVLHGGSDLQPESGSRTYSETFPNATFVNTPLAGHVIWLDDPQAFDSAVTEFLTKLKRSDE